MRVARRFLVSGHVQGVGFRWFAHDAARREGLNGLVRNQADGSVEAIVEGDHEAIERFEAAIRRGPSRSRVTNIEVDSIPPTGHVGFTIE
jgi:acylphosphatase